MDSFWLRIAVEKVGISCTFRFLSVQATATGTRRRTATTSSIAKSEPELSSATFTAGIQGLRKRFQVERNAAEVQGSCRKNLRLRFQ